MRWLPLALVLASNPVAAEDEQVALVRASGRLDGQQARLTARYTIPVSKGWSSETARFALPRGAIVTAARATLGGTTHRLALTEAKSATESYDALRRDEVTPGTKTSAVLVEGTPGALFVSVASPRAATMTLDLELAVPTCFHREVRYFAAPHQWETVGGAVPVARLADGEEVEQSCGRLSDGLSVWVGFAARDVAKLKGPRIGVSGDAIDLGDDRLVKVEVDLANVLADVPRDLATVLVVDGSRSMSDEELKAQRDTVRAYLKSAPGSRVQVVAFARYARPLLSAWMPAASARASVDAALKKLVPENGSNLDAGLGEASTWLARIKGTKRIVLLTDQRMAMRLQTLPAEALAQAVPPGTLVHVVVTTGDRGELVRDDDAKLAGLATATEGMLVRGGADDDDRPVDATRLVRPIELEQLAIVAPGWNKLTDSERGTMCESDVTLGAGTACTWWGHSERGEGKAITLGGKLWGKTIKLGVAPSLARSLDVARELALHAGVPAHLRASLDERARGVNDRWSLYAAWGGPGSYEMGGGTGWGTTCDCGPYGTIGHGSGTGTGVSIHTPPQVPLDKQLADKLATCRLGTERVEVKVELTLVEIADVHVKARTAQGAERHRLEQCVAEVVWASAPAIAQPREHQVMTFVAGNP